MNPDLSVIMPVHNAARFLADSISSVLDQSYPNFEFLICDDASTDATPEILANWARRDQRIKLLRNESNLNVAASLNRLISAAKSDMLIRMDGDDICYHDRFEAQRECMKSGNYDIVFAHANLVDEDGNLICRIHTPPLADCLRLLA